MLKECLVRHFMCRLKERQLPCCRQNEVNLWWCQMACDHSFSVQQLRSFDVFFLHSKFLKFRKFVNCL